MAIQFLSRHMSPTMDMRELRVVGLVGLPSTPPRMDGMVAASPKSIMFWKHFRKFLTPSMPTGTSWWALVTSVIWPVVLLFL